MTAPARNVQFRRPGGNVRLCPTCNTALVRASEIAEMLDLPHSTVALRLKSAGIEPAMHEGARALYVSAVALAAVLNPKCRT